MSLISEALRKARQTATEHEAEQRAGIYRWALPPRPRRPRTGARLALGAAIGIAIGLTGAFALWLVLEAGPPDRHEPTMESQTRASAPAAVPAGLADAGGSEAPVGDAPAAPPDPILQAEGRPAPKPADTADRLNEVPPQPPTASEPELGRPPITAAGPLPPEPEHRAEAPPPAAAAGPAPTSAPESRERVFVLDADLGHVTLSLDFIVFRSVDPFAEVNGIEVRKGSLVEGFRVEAVELDRVILRDADGPLVLRIP